VADGEELVLLLLLTRWRHLAAGALILASRRENITSGTILKAYF
jgi:hypothetical protein